MTLIFSTSGFATEGGNTVYADVTSATFDGTETTIILSKAVATAQPSAVRYPRGKGPGVLILALAASAFAHRGYQQKHKRQKKSQQDFEVKTAVDTESMRKFVVNQKFGDHGGRFDGEFDQR